MGSVKILNGTLTLVQLNQDIPFSKNVDPDQWASKKPTDLDLHCLPFSMWNYINNLIGWKFEVGVSA